MKNSSWALCAAAVLAGDMGLHMLATQPMTERVDSLTAQVTRLQTGIDRLGATAAHAAQASDLLASLVAQGERTQAAREAIEEIRRFEREVRTQSNSVGRSMGLVQNLGRLHEQIIAQSQQLAELNAALEDLSAFQQQVHGLASAASREYAGVDHAMQLVRELGQLKQDVTTQARDIDAALVSLEQLSALKQRAAGETEGIGSANDALDQLAALKTRVAGETVEIQAAEQEIARLIGLKDTLAAIDGEQLAAAEQRASGLAKLQELIVTGSRDLAAAFDLSRQLLSLQDELVTRGGRVDVARKHADGLLSLEDALADDAHLNIGHAQQNLHELLAIQRQLTSQDEQIIAAVEALELMADLQSEFVERIDSLAGLRSGLTELAMLESSIMRTVRSLQPLVELANLRRLNGQDLQAIVRGMLEQRTDRVAAGYPDDLPIADGLRTEAGGSGLAADEPLVPIPPTRD